MFGKAWMIKGPAISRAFSLVNGRLVVLLNFLFQYLARLKREHPSSSDGDGLPGLRIAPATVVFMSDIE